MPEPRKFSATNEKRAVGLVEGLYLHVTTGRAHRALNELGHQSGARFDAELAVDLL